MSDRSPSHSAGDCRCDCGSLLGRWVDGGVELKCRRCKRTLWLALETDWREPSQRPSPASPTTLPALAERR